MQISCLSIVDTRPIIFWIPTQLLMEEILWPESYVGNLCYNMSQSARRICLKYPCAVAGTSKEAALNRAPCLRLLFLGPHRIFGEDKSVSFLSKKCARVFLDHSSE